MKARLLVGAAALLVAQLAWAPGLGAAPATAAADVLGTVRIDRSDPSVALVQVRYVCQPGEEDQWLFVSAKQTEDGNRDDELTADGHWSTHEGNVDAWLQDHPLGAFTCDGRWHVDTFRIHTDPDIVGGQGYGELEAGDVWVQFCLFDGQGNFIYQYEWVPAR